LEPVALYFQEKADLIASNDGKVRGLQLILNLNLISSPEIVLVMERAGVISKERAAALYVEGKTSISGAAEMAGLTIPEMVQLLVSKGYRSSYSLEDFRKGVKMLQKMTKTD